MWNTSQGNRVLRGDEAVVFQGGLDRLVEWLNDCGTDDSWDVGVKVFDRLSYPEKLAVLDHVASALLEENVAAPMQTAVSEGAIAAVYAQLFIDIQVEIDDGYCDVRKLLGQMKANEELAEFIPAVDSKEIEAWHDAVDLVMDQILWDSDWADEIVKPDDSPELAKHVRDFARIDADYYSAVPADPNPAQLERIKANLARLIEMKF